MKIKFLFVLSVVFTTFMNAQQINVLAQSGDSFSLQSKIVQKNSTFTSKFKSSKFEKLLLFKNWNNIAHFYDHSGSHFKVPNSNINLSSQKFLVKYGSSLDSVLVMDNVNIKKTVINGDVYEPFMFEYKYLIGRLLFKNDQFTLYNSRKTKFVKGSPDPMVNRKDRYLVSEKYYLSKNNGDFKIFKLSKKGLIKAFTKTKSEAKELKKYFKTNDLSFKKVDDVVKYLKTL